jgi:hypothetical protein
MMRLLCVFTSLVATVAASTPYRHAWVVIPRGGADDYASQLEVVKSSVLDSSNDSVRDAFQEK